MRSTPLIGLLLLAAGTVAAAPDDVPLEPSERLARTIAQDMQEDQAVLLHPGEGERTLLRFEPRAGDVVTYEATQTLENTRTVDDEPVVANAFPPAIVTITTRIEEVREDGSFVSRSVIDAIRIDDAMGHDPNIILSFGERLAPLAGSAVVETIAPNGQRLEREHAYTEPDNEMAPRLATLAYRPDLLLPEEPVAPGAVWRTLRFTEDEGIRVSSLITCTLRSRTAHTLTIDLHVRYLVDEQAIADFRGPPGSGATIIDGSGSALASYTLSRRDATPIETSLSRATSMTFSIIVPSTPDTLMGVTFAETASARRLDPAPEPDDG